MAKITIAKVSKQLREGISKKTGKEYSFESMGIAPEEDTLMDINGDEFERDGRWLNGSSVDGVTDDWDEGDVVKLQIIRVMVATRDGGKKEVLNFKLPKGTEAMVKKAVPSNEPTTAGADDFSGFDEELDPEDF